MTPEEKTMQAIQELIASYNSATTRLFDYTIKAMRIGISLYEEIAKEEKAKVQTNSK